MVCLAVAAFFVGAAVDHVWAVNAANSQLTMCRLQLQSRESGARQLKRCETQLQEAHTERRDTLKHLLGAIQRGEPTAEAAGS